ncbi:MAG: hypothetical protein K2P35_09600 [Lachnospiraceae bacterium]|nr:hypothetical protein [Lachnospiraceae bacterium]
MEKITPADKTEIWNRLTDDEKREANEKKAKIIEWAVEQENLIMEKLKAEGKWKQGLDSNIDNPELQKVNAEYKHKLDELLKEYGLSSVFEK